MDSDCVVVSQGVDMCFYFMSLFDWLVVDNLLFVLFGGYFIMQDGMMLMIVLLVGSVCGMFVLLDVVCQLLLGMVIFVDVFGNKFYGMCVEFVNVGFDVFVGYMLDGGNSVGFYEIV